MFISRQIFVLQSLLMPRLFTTLALTAVLLHSGIAPAANSDKQIADHRIEAAIEGELWGAKGVKANEIDVSVAEGIATLSGYVNNLLSKESAIRITKMTKGVRAVVDELQVRTVDIADEKLRQAVISALAQDPATDSWEITVKASDGMVTLSGKVESWAERELSMKVVRSVQGVRGVKNNLSVDYDANRTDDDIKADIVQRLSWDARLDDELITVQVKDGKVILSGAVGSDYEKTLARSDSWVAGVKSVDADNLTVEWWSRDDMQRTTAWTNLDDEKIAEAVEDALLYDPRVYSFKLKVSVEDGIVTLRGTVDNLKAKRAAAQDAKNTVGVWQVKNFVKVRPVEMRTNEAIRQDIEHAFQRDPYINRFEITVNVIGGDVYLYGDVDSYYEMEQAEDLAATVNGVTEVHNYLIVSYDYPNYSYDFYDWDPTLYDYDYDYKTTQTKPDADIKKEIESQLWWSPWVDADEVTVTVDQGTATLTGTVDSWSERKSAAENALEGGAVKVINKLDVEY